MTFGDQQHSWFFWCGGWPLKLENHPLQTSWCFLLFCVLVSKASGQKQPRAERSGAKWNCEAFREPSCLGKGLVQRRSETNGAEIKGWNWSWQRRGGKGEAEVRPGGRNQDGNTGMAQEGLMLELSTGSEAPERCHRRGSAPYTSLTLAHHTHESGAAQGSEKTTSKWNISWAAFARLCSTYLLKYHVWLCVYLWFCTRWALLAACHAHLAACALKGVQAFLVVNTQGCQQLDSAAVLPAHMRKALEWEEGFPALLCQPYCSSTFQG